MKESVYTTLLTVSLALTCIAGANPSGQSVVAGTATFKSQGKTLTVTCSNNSIINWQSYSIAANETTKYVLPNSSSRTLSRVTSANPSNILGKLEGNGRLYLINHNGIVFGTNSTVNFPAFLASTLDVPNAEFLAGGTLNFAGTSQNMVKNQGSITATAGDVVLLGYMVENSGTIQAASGAARLAAGIQIVLATTGDERITIIPSIPPPTPAGTGVNNKSTGIINSIKAEIKADGNPFALAIKHDGQVNATGTVSNSGRVFLIATDGNAEINGAVRAKNSSGCGGQIQVKAAGLDFQGDIDASGTEEGGWVELSGSFLSYKGRVSTLGRPGTAGTLLLDPNDITISNGATNPPPPFSGTFFNGAGVGMSVLNNTELQNALQTNNVAIQTDMTTMGGNGDIIFQDEVLWNSGFSLTINAVRDVNVHTQVLNNGSGGISITSGRDLNVGKLDGTLGIPAQIGARQGDVTLNIGGALNVTGGNIAGAFAQLGYDAAAISSDIIVQTVGNGVNVRGGSADHTFALIGHGGSQSVAGTKSGDISFMAGSGAFVIQGGVSDSDYAFAQIGHTSGYGGAVNLTGNIAANFIPTSFTAEGGTGTNSYALFGHGGTQSAQSDIITGDVRMTAGSFQIDGGSDMTNFGCFGFMGFSSPTETITYNSYLIQAISENGIVVHAPDNGLALLGAGLPVGNASIDVALVQVETDNSGTVSLIADDVFTGENIALMGAGANGGGVVSNLLFDIDGDFLIQGGSGAFDSSAFVLNGNDGMDSSKSASITVRGNISLNAGSSEASFQSVGSLTVSSTEGAITLTATNTGQANFYSAYDSTVTSSAAITLNGSPSGAAAFISNQSNNSSVNAGTNLVLNENSMVENSGANNGTLTLIAGSDIVASKGGFRNLGVGDTFVSAGQDINIYSIIENPGSGQVIALAQRDLNIGSATSSAASQLGVASTGAILVSAGRDLNLAGGNTSGAFAQLGCEGNSISCSINILSVGQNLNIQGGTANGAFASIGHGRAGGLGGTKSGAVNLGSISGNVVLLGGNSSDTYAQIGHCHGTSSAVTLSGDISASSITGFLHLAGGDGANSYAIVGHGGNTSAGDSYSGSISVGSSEIVLTGGSAANTMAGIGFTNGQSGAAGAVTIDSTQMSVVSSGLLTLQAGTGSHSTAYIGVSVATNAANAITLGSLSLSSGLDMALTGSSVATNSGAQVGIFTNAGNAGTSLILASSGLLTATANQGGVQISNGNGTPVGTYALDMTSSGNATFQSGVGIASAVSVGTLSLTSNSGGLLLNASSGSDCYITSANALNVNISQNLNLNGISGSYAAYVQNSKDSLTIVAADAALSTNAFITNLGENNGDLNISVDNLTVTGSAASNSYIHNMGSGAYMLTAINDMTILSNIQNPGSGVGTITTGRDLIIGNGTAPLACRLEMPSGQLSIITGRHMTITSSPSGAADVLSNSNQSYSIGGDVILTGVAGGPQAFIRINNDSFSLITGGSVTLNPNTYIRHQGGSNGDLVISVDNLTVIGSSGNNAFIHNLGSGAYSIETTNDFNVLSRIQNPGTGAITVFTGRDLNVGSATATYGSQFGTNGADVSITVIGDLTLTAGNSNNAFAQIGGQASSVSGNITINTVGGNLTLTGDTADNTFAQIGHRGPVTLQGSITVGEVGGATTLNPGAGLDDYANISHFTGAVIP